MCWCFCTCSPPVALAEPRIPLIPYGYNTDWNDSLDRLRVGGQKVPEFDICVGCCEVYCSSETSSIDIPSAIVDSLSWVLSSSYSSSSSSSVSLPFCWLFGRGILLPPSVHHHPQHYKNQERIANVSYRNVWWDITQAKVHNL